jgi:fibronectin-binding autotransporter adhesin
LAVLLSASVAFGTTAQEDRATWFDMNLRGDDVRVADARFNSGFQSFYHGPPWLLRALSNPAASLNRVEFTYDRSGDRVYEAEYVGTLREQSATNLFSDVRTFAGPITTSSALVPAATGATIVWANIGVDWAAGSNWVGGTAPADSTTANIASFGSNGIGSVNPNLAIPRSISGIIFESGAFSYTVTGSVLTIGADGIANSATSTQTFSNSIALAANQSWTTDTGGHLVVNGTVNMNPFSADGRALVITGGGHTTLNNTILSSFPGSFGNLSMNGPGTLTLNGNNTYTGGTSVLSGGTLLINGNHAVSGLVIATGSGSVLGGTGTIAGAVTVTDARITGGTNGTVGMLTLNSGLTFNGSGGYAVDLLGGTSDLLAITGTLNLSGLSDVIAFNGTADGTSSYTLATYSSITGTFNSVIDLPMGYTLVYGANELDLVPVPEPSTWIGAALALAAIGFTQRRRLRSLLAK